MSERVSQFILLCEDTEQARLVRAYMELCGLETREPVLIPIVASKRAPGGNVGWVLRRFPDELHACRRRSKRAKTTLIVVVDADQQSVDARRRQLYDRVIAAGHSGFGANEPAVLLIPKRHVETWLCALLGRAVNEDEDCKSLVSATKATVSQAARALYDWSRPGASPGPTCVPSLESALPEWHRIG